MDNAEFEMPQFPSIVPRAGRPNIAIPFSSTTIQCGSMVDSFRTQFLESEKFFIYSLSQGPNAMNEFSDGWSSLHARFTQALAQENVDDDTITLAYQIASRIEIIAQEFVEVESVTSAFHRDLEDMFSDLRLDDDVILPEPASRNSSYPKKRQTIQMPTYIPNAHSWLVANLHNPYPSVETRSKLAHETCSPVKDIDNWFTDIRKRIGWNALRRKHFSNKRRDIVEAATRYFRLGETSPRDSYSIRRGRSQPEVDLTAEFVALEARAHQLYLNKLSETTVTVPSSRTSPAPLSSWASRSYPSPERSPDRYSEPPSPLQHSQIARKRRRSHSTLLDTSDNEYDEVTLRPTKRKRSNTFLFSDEEAAATLPSPAPSLPDLQPDGLSATPTSTRPIGNTTNKKRKRSPSDTTDGPVKRQLTSSSRPYSAFPSLCIGPVGDVLDVDEMFSHVFGANTTVSHAFPDPVCADVPDNIGPVEVSSYQYCYEAEQLQPIARRSSASVLPQLPVLSDPDGQSGDDSNGTQSESSLQAFQGYSFTSALDSMSWNFDLAFELEGMEENVTSLSNMPDSLEAYANVFVPNVDNGPTWFPGAYDDLPFSLLTPSVNAPHSTVCALGLQEAPGQGSKLKDSKFRAIGSLFPDIQSLRVDFSS